MSLAFRAVMVVFLWVSTLLTLGATPPVASASATTTIEAVESGSPWVGFPSEYLTNPVSGEVSVMWVDSCKVWMADRNLSGWTTPNHIVNGCNFDAEYAEDGTLHLVVDRYSYIDGNWETYHSLRRNQTSEWTLTVLVSRTSGDSRYPKLAVWGRDVYATWQDKTPGYWTVYIAQYTDGAVVAMSEMLRSAKTTATKPESIQLDSEPLDVRSFWSNAPIPNGQGTMPVIKIDQLGELFVAWQDWGEVWLTARQQSSTWCLPVNVSDSETESSGPVLTINPFRADSIRVFWRDTGAVWYANAWFLNSHLALSEKHRVYGLFLPFVSR